MSEEVRYWPRLGIYVTRKFAEEYIERSEGSGITGEYLDEDIEEFQQITTVSPMTLEREIEELFEAPFVEAELPDETRIMFELIEMEKRRASIIKEYKAEGMSLEDAKERYNSEVNEMVSVALGIEGGSTSGDRLNEEE